MTTSRILLAAATIAALARPALPAALPQSNITVLASDLADDRDRDDRDDRDDEKESKAEREESMYDAGIDMLDDHEWKKAAAAFDRVAELRMAHADAALYWKAYAQNKLGQRSEAVTTLALLQKSYPKSRWVEDGKTLEVEIRQASGLQPPPPERIVDEELKLMALSSLMNNDAERAVPILEDLLNGKASPKLKDRALFVLSQSSSPKALDILSRTAKSGPAELRGKAIRYLGIMGGERNRQVLTEIYSSSSDIETKKSILKSFMIAGDRARLLNLAKKETVQELRGDAITQLGVSGAKEELAELYTTEPSIELRKKIIQAMFIGGNSEKLGEIARAEKVPELRLTAIKNLGLMGDTRSGSLLTSIYQTDSSPEVRKAVINGLFLQNNASALVALARAEKDPEVKKAIISKLSIMHSKVASDYLMEFLRD
jgi:HEAT repeat protein